MYNKRVPERGHVRQRHMMQGVKTSLRDVQETLRNELQTKIRTVDEIKIDKARGISSIGRAPALHAGG